MIISRSPLRISLGGGGTDLESYYSKQEGFVVSAAIDKFVYIGLHKIFPDGIIIKYSKYEKIDYEVYHHTQVIEDLIKNKKITVKQNNNDKVTFHDPCNLSRGMDESNEDRRLE